jgi:hypothetical protein
MLWFQKRIHLKLNFVERVIFIDLQGLVIAVFVGYVLKDLTITVHGLELA